MNQFEEMLLEYTCHLNRILPDRFPEIHKFVRLETEMSERVSAALDITSPQVKACFDNSFTAVCWLQEATYCLGHTICDRVPIPIEHAWIKHDGKYYDPTFLWLNKMSEPEDCAYGVMYEFTRADLLDFLKVQPRDDQYPPNLMNVRRYAAHKIAA